VDAVEEILSEEIQRAIRACADWELKRELERVYKARSADVQLKAGGECESCRQRVVARRSPDATFYRMNGAVFIRIGGC
jgi:hypothetical protein